MRLLNESKIIEIFKSHLRNKNSDDVEVFPVRDFECITKVDTLVASTDVPPNMSSKSVGKKSVVAPVSDFAAKGIQPKYAIVSVTIPRVFTKPQLDNLAAGIASACNKYKIRMLGGDTNEGKDLVVSLCLFGVKRKDKPMPKRKGAKQGDLIFTTGLFGYSAAGLEIILNKKKSSPQFSKKANSAVLKPEARLEFGVKANKHFTSSMDSSDGLAITLNELSKESKCKLVITNPPANQELIDFSSKNKLSWKKLIFEGGEEYEIVFTAKSKDKKILLRKAKASKVNLKEIGYVSKGTGVYLKEKGNLVKVPDAGWRHLS